MPALAALAAALPGQVAAQEEDYRRIVTIMRACATIEDVPARVACYDNNIRPAAGSVAATPAPSAPSAPPAPAGSAVRQAEVAPQGPGGFGADQVPQARAARQETEEQEMEVRVARASELQPGIHVLTLEDGAQWQFVDPAPPSYDPPRAGSLIRIQSASLGSFLMRYQRQPSIRVRRIR
jgi:hypothetical protein